MSAPWQPLSVRISDEPVEEILYEGIPPHLGPSLEEWIKAVATDYLAERVALRLRLGRPPGWSWHALLLRDPSLMLDVIDALMYLHPGLTPIGDENDHIEMKGAALRMKELLSDAGSAYKVADDKKGLTRRIDETVREAASHVEQQANTNARDHLRAAWAAAYGLRPDPAKAYGEAIKAVEAASIPVVLPKGHRETLGKVRSHLRDAPTKWELAIPGQDGKGDVGPVVSMLGLLWEGQSDRHGGSPLSRPISQESAEMAVHLGTTLVQWFSAGYIWRRP
jgi:hypothetical protein